MNQSYTESGSCVPNLISKLCNHFANKDPDLSSRYIKIAMSFLTSSISKNENKYDDEQYVIADIRNFLQITQSSESIENFNFLYVRLQNSGILQNKCALLQFFLYLGKELSQEISQWNMPPAIPQPLSKSNSAHSQNMSPAISQPLSKSNSVHSQNMSPAISQPLSKSNSAHSQNMSPAISQPLSESNSAHSQITFLPEDVESVTKLFSGILKKNPSSSSKSQMISQGTSSVGWSYSDQDLYTLKERSSLASLSRPMLTSVSECQLIQEVIYTFQGIEGKILRKEPDGLGFTIDLKTGKGITPIQRGLLERLSGIGFLHNQLKQHCDEADKQNGLIGQSFISILREELINYYQLVAMLQAQLKRQGCFDHTELSLRRMIVWVAEPQMQLQWLAHVAELCNDKKGGALITAVHGFLQHGASCVQKVAEKVLCAICRPLYLMLTRWLLDGEISDPCGEFFIEARNVNVAERLWHDKYYVRKTMIPSFITVNQAKKILATGKSINFLRQICKDSEELPGRDALQKLFANTKAEALFSPEQSIELHSALDSMYRETSLRVIHLLKDKYRLVEHLQSLRRYLLLGQGDFIRHLLELLVPELCKPAQQLYHHTLSAILEFAIRVTNAQYEDEDTLMRLNVGMMNHSHGDIGWDVFTLTYLVDGPVRTIFQHTMPIYKCLFGALWMAKRMEFVLSNMRKQQITNAKLLRNIVELKPVSHLIHVLASKMINFLYQTQYYFLFEVLECSWAEMLKQVNQAECLDDIINAHATFLSSVQRGVLLDINFLQLRSQLRIIFSLILNLESLQESLYTVALKERDVVVEYQKRCLLGKGFRAKSKNDLEIKERTMKFLQYLTSINRQVKQLMTKYTEFVEIYLKLLATNTDMNLQLLSVRLNFNDYYKIT